MVFQNVRLRSCFASDFLRAASPPLWVLRGQKVRILVLGFTSSHELEARSCRSSRWIFHPLDDPYRLFANNDAGSSGIAENNTKFFFTNMHVIACISP